MTTLRTLLLFFLAVILGGCAFSAPSPSPLAATSGAARNTNTPSITAPSNTTTALSQTTKISPSATRTSAAPVPASPTVSATPTHQPSPTRTPTAIRSATVTAKPTITRTPTQTPGIPNAAVQIFAPGAMSKVVAPLPVSASVRVSSSKAVYVALYGEDGRLLASQLINYAVEANTRVSVELELDFAISAVAEAARLQISTKDTYGRLTALGSTELLLLSVGQNEENPVSSILEPLVIRQPGVNTLIQGGTVTVEGLIRPQGNGLLLAQMVTADGRVVGVAQSAVAVSSGEYVPFQIKVAYSVSALTWVRLIVEEGGGRIPGAAQLNSLEILLSP